MNVQSIKRMLKHNRQLINQAFGEETSIAIAFRIQRSMFSKYYKIHPKFEN